MLPPQPTTCNVMGDGWTSHSTSVSYLDGKTINLQDLRLHASTNGQIQLQIIGRAL